MSGQDSAALPALAPLPDASAVAAAAALFPAIGARTDAATEAVAAAWRGLDGPGVFETPDTGQVRDAMRAPRAVAELVQVRAAAARTALENYASTLAALATRATALQPDIAAVQAAAAAPPPPPSAPPAVGPQPADVAARISALNADIAAADEECAQALGRLAQLVHIPGVSTVIAAHEWDEHGGELFISLGEETIARYRRILVPKEGGPLPRIVEPAPVEVVATNDGIEFAQSGKLLLPAHLVQGPMPEIDTRGMRGKGVFTGAPEEVPGGIPAWAKIGRVAGVVGVGLTVAGTGFAQFEEDQENHPEWSTGRDAADAGLAAATTGAGAAAGAWAGAELGGEAGAAIGTMIFPGPGTVVGGIVGGVIGGLIGGNIGGKIGSGVHDLASKIGSWF